MLINVLIQIEEAIDWDNGDCPSPQFMFYVCLVINLVMQSFDVLWGWRIGQKDQSQSAIGLEVQVYLTLVGLLQQVGFLD